MYPYLRLCQTLIKAKFDSQLTLENERVLKMRVFPGDIDIYPELNNGRHLTIMDLGRLLISSRDTAREPATQGDWVAWLRLYEDIAECREDQYRIRLMDNKKDWDCGYPGVEVLPDGTFVLTTYGHWIEEEPPFHRLREIKIGRNRSNFDTL